MISIKFEGLQNENIHKKDKSSSQWQEWRSLKLNDVQSKKPIAEWFYVVACDAKTYTDLAPDSVKPAYQIQAEFDEKELVKFAEEKINNLHFDSWDDFYSKMEKEFINDD